MNMQTATKQYQQVDNHSGVMDASPHELIAMLINGALTRLSTAKGCIQRQDNAGKGEQLGKGIDIITGLQASLDLEAGGDISQQLDALYEYMIKKLMHASVNNDMSSVDEVIMLLREIKTGWDSIPSEFHYLSNNK